MKVDVLLLRYNKFIMTWLSNPAAQLEFVRLLEETQQMPSADHADFEFHEWVASSKESLKRIGVR